MIQAQAISSWESYRSASRIGRGRPLTVKDQSHLGDHCAIAQHLMLKDVRRISPGLCRQALELPVTGRAQSVDAVALWMKCRIWVRLSCACSRLWQVMVQIV